MLVPATAYLYLAHPDWAWLYLLDGRRVPRLFVLPAVAGAAAALFGGYYATARLIAARVAPRQILGAVGGVGVVALLLVLLARSRLLRYGSTAEFRAGRTVSLFAVKLGFVLVALVVGLAAATAYVAWELWRDGRRAQAR